MAKKATPKEWHEFQDWLQGQLDRKFKDHEERMKEMLEGASRSWQLGTRPRNLSENSARFFVEGSHALSEAKETAWEVPEIPPSPREDREEAKPSPHVTRILGKEVVREKLQNDPTPFKSFVKKSLDSYVALVVLLNLGSIIAMTEWTVQQTNAALGLPSPTWEGVSAETFEIMEYIFFVIYLTDVLLRIATLRREWYYDQLEGIMYLNIFDGILVLVNIFELLALPALMMGGDPQQATTIRVIKLVRIVRTLRIFKTVSVFRQLRILVGTCVASMGALLWSMVLLTVLQVGFALAMCQALQLYILDTSESLDTRMEMHALYGSFPKALYTMFEVTFSGSWPTRVRPVIEKVDAWYALPFTAYVTFVVFAVIKIVTALFLKETLTSAANDADMVMEDARRLANDYQHKLEELFRLADDDGDGNLSREEFVDTMSLPSVQHYLRTLDMSIQDVRPLFDILDDGDGLITIPEFVRGLSQLKGQARAVDFVILQKENAKLMAECQKIRRDIRQVQVGWPSILNRLSGKVPRHSPAEEETFQT